MAQQLPDQNTLDSLTEALIPSNIYLDSWNQPELARSSNNHSFPYSSDTLAPGFGATLPLSTTTGYPAVSSENMTLNHSAFDDNSADQFDHDEYREETGVGNALNPCSQTDLFQIKTLRTPTGRQSHAGVTPLRIDVSESNATGKFIKDPLANLKLRAKESVRAKRAQSVRSASNESRQGPANLLGPDLSPKGGNNVAQLEDTKSNSGLSHGVDHGLLPNQPSLPITKIYTSSTKAPSLGLEDLIAEGKAAASLPVAKKDQTLSSTKHRGSIQGLHQSNNRDLSENGEIREFTSGRDQDAMVHKAQPSAEHVPADEIDEIDIWLSMTGYHDQTYRKKVIRRYKRLQEIEEEKLKLLEEEQEDHRLRTPFGVSQRVNLPTAAARLPPKVARRDDVDAKTIGMAEETLSNGNISLKRSMGEHTDSIQQTKMARTGVVHHRTPPRSQRASPERGRDLSVSLAGDEKTLPAPTHIQSSHARNVQDRWSDREADNRGATNHSPEDYIRRNDHGDRTDNRRNSVISTSQPSNQDTPDGRVRFFLLKSWNYENIATAQKEGTWATQTKNEDVFVESFKTCRHVIFFFSANHSKAFQGYARMQGLPGEKGVHQPSWVKNLHWPTTAPFKLRWIVKEETPYRAVGNLKNPLNENLAIFVGRDGQEIPEKLGLQLCDIIDEDTSYRADFRR